MATKLKKKGRSLGEVASRFHEKHATYKTSVVYVPPIEGNDNTGYFKVSRNLDINLLECWITRRGGFDGSHLRTAYRCRDLWAQMPKPYWKPQESENAEHAYAAKTLLRLKRSVPRDEWEIFENALRWNEPGGYIGSRLISPPSSQIEATKYIVKRVLEALA